MVITKREDITKQDFCVNYLYSEESSVFGEVSLCYYLFNLIVAQVGGVGVGTY